MNKLGYRTKIFLLLIFVIVGFILTPNLTDSLIYNYLSWTNETVASGEKAYFGYGIKAGYDYTKTKSFDGVEAGVLENNTNRLLWDYDFNTTFNKTQTAQIMIIIENITYTNEESLNITIRNYNTYGWDNLNQTELTTDTKNITTVLSWSNRNLTQYVKASTGQMAIAFEDINQSPNQNTMYIDYLGVRATFSPLNAQYINFTNSTGWDQWNGTNYTRASLLNATAEWNASNVTFGAIYVNTTYNTTMVALTQVNTNYTNYTFNFSDTSLFPLAGNVTVWFSANDSWYQTNASSPGLTRWFGLFSNASVVAMAKNETSAVVGTSPVRVYCKVVDENSSVPIDGYNVSFYNDTSLVGYAGTNSTGRHRQTFSG